MTQGWESLHYLEKTVVPVFEIEVDRPCRIRSVIRWT
jgi:hypothetical protein